MKPLRIAIVGAGTWGEVHAGIFREFHLSETVAICDRDLEKAKRVAERFGIKDVYADADEMLNKIDCDAVSVVTPDYLHADIAVKCAEAGKHLLIEKPIATTREDTLKIVDAVNKNKVRAMVDLHNRWNPPFAAAKDAITAGELGEIQNGYFRLNDIKWVATDLLPWAAKSSIIWFLGSHSLDTLRWLFDDDVKRVYSVSRSGVLNELGIDTVDMYLTTLEFINGGVAQMENGWITPNGSPNVNDIKCSVLGSRGMVSIDASSHNLMQKYTDANAKVPDILVNNYIHGRARGFAFESIRSFAERVITGEEFIVTLEDAAKTTLALLAVMESAETRTPVEVRY